MNSLGSEQAPMSHRRSGRQDGGRRPDPPGGLADEPPRDRSPVPDAAGGNGTDDA